jgi:hypothetical protein
MEDVIGEKSHILKISFIRWDWSDPIEDLIHLHVRSFGKRTRLIARAGETELELDQVREE